LQPTPLAWRRVASGHGPAGSRASQRRPDAVAARLRQDPRPVWALDPASRTLRVEIDLPNSTGRLRPGMYATVRFMLEEPASETPNERAALGGCGSGSRLAVRNGRRHTRSFSFRSFVSIVPPSCPEGIQSISPRLQSGGLFRNSPQSPEGTTKGLAFPPSSLRDYEVT
jgi:hypothetical protein